MEYPSTTGNLPVENLAEEKVKGLCVPFNNDKLTKNFMWAVFLFTTAQRNLDTLFAAKVKKFALMEGIDISTDNEVDISAHLDAASNSLKVITTKDAKTFAKQFAVTVKSRTNLFSKLLSMSKINSFLVLGENGLTFATLRVPYSFNNVEITEHQLIKMYDSLTLASLNVVDVYTYTMLTDFSANVDAAILACETRAMKLSNTELNQVSETKVAQFSRSDSDACVSTEVVMHSLINEVLENNLISVINDLETKDILVPVKGEYNIATADNCNLVNAVTEGGQQ